MIKTKSKIKIAVLLVVLLIFTALSPIFYETTISYAINKDVKFEKTNVLDDLKSSTVNGKPFNINDFPYDSTGLVKHPEIINFVEYCYSFKVNMQINYGLYLYFYNPQNLNLDTTNRGNKIQMAVSYDDDGIPNSYEKFDLQFCSKVEESKYKNLFYKFKVVDRKSSDGKTILQRVNSNERRYDVSGVELVTYGKPNAIDYTVGGSYKFSGYVKGYGADIGADSNLVSKVNELETIKLEVTSTNFRTESSPAGIDHQNELNSVYFSVPKIIFDKYGKLQKIKAEWYEYKTTPIIVTQDPNVFNGMQASIGKKIANPRGYDTSIPYGFLYNGKKQGNMTVYDWTYNGYYENANNDFAPYPSKNIENLLTYIFYTDGENKKDYELPKKKLSDYIYNYDKSNFKGYLNIKNNSISADLFLDNVDAGRTLDYNKVLIDADDKFDLLSYKDSHSFWEKVGDYGLWSTLFNKTPSDEKIPDISPIYEVKDSDISNPDISISNNLLINEKDINDNVDTKGFKSYYNQAKKQDELTFLFRFAVTDYFAGKLESIGKIKDNAYMAQETVFFGFDILELTFNKNGIYRLIPVVSNPIDIINGITPPTDPKGNNWVKTILIIILLIIIFFICIRYSPIIITFIVKILGFILSLILLPFKLIGKAFKKNKAKSKKE